MATDELGGTAQPTRALGDLPPEVLDRIISLLPLRNLASLNASARLFHAAPPGGCSPVERALRERARARGHERALLATLPFDAGTWTGELFMRERVLELACAHASPVAAGYDFSAFVDAEGGLHTCGEEGVRDDRFQLTGEWRAHIAIGHSGVRVVRAPTRVATLSAVRVVAVAAGRSHLLALSEAGAVYGCGYNRYGQLGLGDKEERREFEPIVALAGAVVLGIAAGGSHSLALTAAGCAYSWGFNSDGQLGHGDTKERCEPTRIEALDGVRVGGVAAGGYHTLLLSVQGAVYSCGIGKDGRLGHGDQEVHNTPRRTARRTPTRIEALAGVRAVHVSAGWEHSLVVDAEGGAHSFGGGSSGRLGHGGKRDQRTPRRIDALAGVRAVRACAGDNSSAVLGADGSVHTFGGNEYGLLGLGSQKMRHAVPSHVAALAPLRVVRCAMGHSHSLFVSADGSVYACGRRSAALGLGMSEDDEQDEPTHRAATPACVETAWRVRLSADTWVWRRPAAPLQGQ